MTCMTDRKTSIRDELLLRILASKNDMPTSSFARFGRLALTALKGRRLIGLEADETPDVEALAAMVTSIGRLKGVAMKVGQIMSYIDIALPEDLRQALAVLQTHSPPMSFDVVREIISADLGDSAEEILAGMEQTSVAAASIGQVQRTTLPCGERLAVKVRYPEIDKAIESDFRPAAAGMAMASLFYPGAKFTDMVNEARDRFLEECDYVHEAGRQECFARIFAGHPVIFVPATHPRYCSPRVLTSDWVDGQMFETFLEGNPSSSERDRIGLALFEFYIGTLFQHRLYNCDPHPGNYLFMPDGRLAILDYGCTREFEPCFVLKLAELTRAVHVDTRDALHKAFLGLGMVHEGRKYDFETARALVRSFYGPMLRDEELVIARDEPMSFSEIAKNKRELMKLSLPGEFLFLFRIRFGLMSVLAKLGARANWYRLEQRYIGSLQRFS